MRTFAIIAFTASLIGAFALPFIQASPIDRIIALSILGILTNIFALAHEIGNE